MEGNTKTENQIEEISPNISVINVKTIKTTAYNIVSDWNFKNSNYMIFIMDK